MRTPLLLVALLAVVPCWAGAQLVTTPILDLDAAPVEIGPSSRTTAGPAAAPYPEAPILREVELDWRGPGRSRVVLPSVPVDTEVPTRRAEGAALRVRWDDTLADQLTVEARVDLSSAGRWELLEPGDDGAFVLPASDALGLRLTAYRQGVPIQSRRLILRPRGARS